MTVALEVNGPDFEVDDGDMPLPWAIPEVHLSRA